MIEMKILGILVFQGGGGLVLTQDGGSVRVLRIYGNEPEDAPLEVLGKLSIEHASFFAREVVKEAGVPDPLDPMRFQVASAIPLTG